MPRLRLLVNAYGALFTHGVIAGVLLALTLYAGQVSG
jgi:hypothetical protein